MLSLTVVEKPQGVVVYRGPSNINGKPIIAVVTGLNAKSENAKTGGMVQVYILAANEKPHKALWNGNDEAVCGDCPHRVVNGAGTCYVNPIHGPLPVYNADERGLYPDYSPDEAGKLIMGRVVRLGAYGDPAAVPIEVWDGLLKEAGGWTGYTHQWRRAFARGYKKYCMASVETERAKEFAHSKGWRTFRIRENEQDALLADEMVCPASAEAGKRLTCEDCNACSGGNPPKVSVAIIAHGTNWKKARLVKAIQKLKRRKRMRCY